MPRSYSATARSGMNAVSSRERPLILLEIDHPDLAAPVRVVRDTQDITVNGNVFVAMGFDITLPDDLGEGLPRARLSIDNVGRELTTWLEASRGGQGATCRIMQVMRSTPTVIEFDMTMDLSNVVMTPDRVTGTLGFDDTLNRPGVTLTYRPDTAPGLF